MTTIGVQYIFAFLLSRSWPLLNISGGLVVHDEHVYFNYVSSVFVAGGQPSIKKFTVGVHTVKVRQNSLNQGELV